MPILASYRRRALRVRLKCVLCCSPVKKMFRFQCGDAASPIAGAPLESPYSMGRRGNDVLGSPLASPKRAQRKIARSPFKASRGPCCPPGSSHICTELHHQKDITQNNRLASFFSSCASLTVMDQLECFPSHHGANVQVLDAPQLTDDFYLNLVDWSSQNVLAVGLGPCVYLWSACTSKVRADAHLPSHTSFTFVITIAYFPADEESCALFTVCG